MSVETLLQGLVSGLLGFAPRIEATEPFRLGLDRVRKAAEENSARRVAGLVAMAKSEALAMLGENDQAFVWLRKSIDDSSARWVKVDPTLDSLRTDPRFSQILKDTGLPP